MAKKKYRLLDDGPQVVYGVKTFMESPLAPTPDSEDNSGKLASTEFVKENTGTNPASADALSILELGGI